LKGLSPSPGGCVVRGPPYRTCEGTVVMVAAPTASAICTLFGASGPTGVTPSTPRRRRTRLFSWCEKASSRQGTSASSTGVLCPPLSFRHAIRRSRHCNTAFAAWPTFRRLRSEPSSSRKLKPPKTLARSCDTGASCSRRRLQIGSTASVIPSMAAVSSNGRSFESRRQRGAGSSDS